MRRCASSPAPSAAATATASPLSSLYSLSTFPDSIADCEPTFALQLHSLCDTVAVAGVASSINAAADLFQQSTINLHWWCTSWYCALELYRIFLVSVAHSFLACSLCVGVGVCSSSIRVHAISSSSNIRSSNSSSRSSRGSRSTSSSSSSANWINCDLESACNFR